MPRFYKKVSTKIGLPPGTLVHVGDRAPAKTRIQLFEYSEEYLKEEKIENIERCFPSRDNAYVSWINMDGLGQIDLIEKIDDHFGIHPLVLEDIVSTGQRPKLEEYDNYIYIVIKMLYVEPKTGDINTEQVSLILGPNYVLSFQEREGDVFDHVRDRIRKSKGRVRKMGPDYLAYCLLDAIVDNYFLVLENIGERIERLEEVILEGDGEDKAMIKEIHKLKRTMIFVRKQVWPLREVINLLHKGENPLIHEKTGFFLRDVHDHMVQVMDTIESFREMLMGMQDVYLSTISNRMNEVMKFLTVFASIFIPLTFIAGVYGMNFDHIPELHWRYGYAGVWLVMIAVTAGMLIIFKRKNWL